MRDLDWVAAALNDPRLAAARLTLEGPTDATSPEGYNRQRLAVRLAGGAPRAVMPCALPAQSKPTGSPRSSTSHTWSACGAT